MKRVIIIILAALFLFPQTAGAKKPSAAESFTEQYNAAAAKGKDALQEFSSDIMNSGSKEDVEMLGNLLHGKTADGKARPKGPEGKPQGFMGDPKDPGPQDWSDWNIKTDGKGNVIGFEEKDFEEKDADGDGKIDDKEREQWNEKKKKEHEEAGGAPGEVPPIPEWDQDGDGKPDKGWDRWCWQCCKGQEEEKNECHSGMPGNCDNGGSCDISEQCIPANETHDGVEYECHQCEYKTDVVDWCAERGYFSSASCNGQCSAGPCIPVDVDIKDGSIVPTNKTRERGSTRQCYTCMKVESIEITYISIIVETPFGIYVLDKDIKDKLGRMADFDVSSVMGMARADGPAMSKIKGMMGSLGFDAMALLGNPMNINSLGSLLKQGMTDRRNKYSDDCFEDFQTPNFAGAQEPPTSSSKKDIKEAKRNKKKGIEGGPRTEGPQEFGTDPQQAMEVDGPIIACGKSGREKALMVLDSAGNPVEKILQSTLEANPNAITDALTKAQAMNRQIQSLVQGGPKGLIATLRQKAVAMVTKKVQDVVFGKKGDPATEVDPNDQFYMHIKEKDKKLFGFLGGSKENRPKLSLGGIQIGKKVDTHGTRQKLELNDQWGIQRIGYLPMDDESSAWKIAAGEQKNVIVAVVDSGIDLEHPDLPQYIWTNPNETPDNGIDDDGNGLVDDIHGWNFVDDNNDLTDERGHGTHVAGIIAAKRNNSIGIAGINPGAIIMPVKVADKEGETDSVKVYQGINYALTQGAQVINVSLGGRGDSQMLQTALNRAREMGVFVTVASGNTGEYLGEVSPASAVGAFTVSAIDHDGKWSTISSVGPNNALLAPGEEILSLRSKDSYHKRAVRDPVLKFYFRQSGTSFATPMAAATASLMLTKDPDLTPAQIEDILLNTATDMGDEGWDGQHGAGLLNATEALKAVGRTDFLTVKLDRFKINRDDRDRMESVDVYATVRGVFDEFSVSAGKGKRAGRFELMAGPFAKEADNAWVARITKDNLRGSDDWIIKIDAKDKTGQTKSAQALLELE